MNDCQAIGRPRLVPFVAALIIAVGGNAAETDIPETGAAPNLDAAASSQAQGTIADQTRVEDEIRVVGERSPLTLEERLRIYEELAKARELYAKSKFDAALPLLLKTARKGFKNAQARVGHIYLKGLGETEQDPVEGLGWLGVASSGTTSAPIRNTFNDLWSRLPDNYVAGFEEVVEEYRSKYDENATGVKCEIHRPLRSWVKELVCYFEQDLPEMVRDPLADHIRTSEQHLIHEQIEQRERAAALSRAQQGSSL